MCLQVFFLIESEHRNTFISKLNQIKKIEKKN